MTKDKIQDFTYRITNANKTEMIVILYDIGLTYLKDAVKDIDNADFSGMRTEIGRCRNTLRELMNSVDTHTDIGHNIMKLYIFCSGELTKAFMDYDKNALNHVINVFTKLREAYVKVSEQDKSEAIMEHTENVFSGFTYGRNLKAYDFTDKDFNRGVWA